MSEFIIDYEFDGNQWSFSIFAKDREEANAKLRQLKQTALLFGVRV